MLAVVEGIDSLSSIEMVLKVDESETFALPFEIDLEDSRGDGSELGEHIPELFFRNLRIQVLNVDVRELFLLFVNLGHALLNKTSSEQLDPAETRAP